MMVLLRSSLFAILLGLALIPPAQGFGWRYSSGYHVSYYYPSLNRYYYYPVYHVPEIAVCPVPVVSAPLFAVPRPAPPSSQTAEPPLAPTISENRSGSKYPPMGDRCRVGFWNISGQDLTLKVNGQARTLLSNRAITLELERDFVWQVTGRDPHKEQVPAGQYTHEIILRL